MSDEINATENANAENVSTETVERSAADILEGINRQYYPNANLEQAFGLIAECLNAGLDVKFNFDVNDPDAIPATHGLLILPIQRREDVVDEQGKATDEKKQVKVGVCVAAVPSIETVAADPAGQAYIQDAVLSAFGTKIGNSLRAQESNPDKPLPFSLKDYIESQRPGEMLKAFNSIAEGVIKSLHKLGMKSINKTILRKCLLSESYAESQYPKVPQPVWVDLLNKMIVKGQSENMDTSLFLAWLEHRAETEVAEETAELDVESLAELSL